METPLLRTDAAEKRAQVKEAANLLREQIWQFVPPKENGLPLKLVDLLEKEALDP